MLIPERGSYLIKNRARYKDLYLYLALFDFVDYILKSRSLKFLLHVRVERSTVIGVVRAVAVRVLKSGVGVELAHKGHL